MNIRLSHLFAMAVAAAFLAGFSVHAAVFPGGPGGSAFGQQAQPGGGASLPAQGTSPAGAPSGPASVSEDDDPVVGSKDAKVVMIEFSDFQCPFCRRFYTASLPELERDYFTTGKVRFVYRDFPLDQIHPGARPYALAADCAEEQGKWREMHNKIFDEQNKKGQGTVTYDNYTETAKQWAREVGLNPTQFNACLDAQKYNSEVEKDLQDGLAASVGGTPTFFIGNAKRGFVSVVGAQPTTTLRQTLDQELAAA